MHCRTSSNTLKRLCRVCLQLPEEDNKLDLTIIYDEEESFTYGQCFTICTRIHLDDPHLPQNLCKSCGLELQMSYDFKKKVEESSRSLEQYQQHIEKVKCMKRKDSEEPNEWQSEHSLEDSSNFVSTHGSEEPNVDICVDTTKDFQIFNTEDQESYTVVSGPTSNNERIIDGDLVDEEEDGQDINIENISQVDENLVEEEHLYIEDFDHVEALDDAVIETEPKQMNSRSSMPIILKIEGSEKYMFEENIVNDNIYYSEVALKNVAEEDAQESQHGEPGDIGDRSWQENVVVVANKEHLPLESENEEPCNEHFDYETIQSGKTCDVVVELNHLDKNSETADYDGDRGVLQSRKRHIGSYSCSECHKVFPNYSRMMTHRRCHDTDRPKYPCLYCSRIYATKQAMECHIQTFHDKTGFTCSICNKVFAIRRSLQVHMRFHNGVFPYACNMCDKKFAQIGHLNTHKNVKHNSIRFGCDYPECGKFFTSSTSLRNHEFSHGIMPFECQYCQRGYPAKSKLRIHVKRKHGMDLSNEELEDMRKFHVMRSKVNLVKVVSVEEDDET